MTLPMGNNVSGTLRADAGQLGQRRRVGGVKINDGQHEMGRGLAAIVPACPGRVQQQNRAAAQHEG